MGWLLVLKTMLRTWWDKGERGGGTRRKMKGNAAICKMQQLKMSDALSTDMEKMRTKIHVTFKAKCKSNK